MITAKNILRKKQFIKDEMDSRLEDSNELWMSAEKRLEYILNKYNTLSREEQMHPYGYIFPCAAIYLTIKDSCGAETAYDIIEQAAIKQTTAMGERIAKSAKMPGFKSFFISMWRPLSRKMFGPSRGFRNVFYPKEKNAYRMDILACPYNTYFSELGCPELTKIFCDNDDRTYGHIPGLCFERTQTLGRGGDKCDFSIRKV